MLLRVAELEAIRAGRIDVAFRRWERPRLRVGTKMRTAVGLVEVTAVEQITARLDRLDAARDEPWTRPMLALIEQQPETQAAELAAQQDRELHAFKRDVRKLKELGLTESLERGYRLSPRGRAAMRRSRA